MSSNYTLWLYSAWGTVRGVLPEVLHLRYRRVVNQTGHYRADNVANRLPCRILVRYCAALLRLLEADSRIEIWRDGRLEMETCWLVQRVRVLHQAGGPAMIEIGAVPALSLLARRIVAYAVGSPQAERIAPADVLLKALVRENWGSAASDPARNQSDWLRVAPDATGTGSAVPVIALAVARQVLLDVAQQASAAAHAAGTLLWFDIVRLTPTLLEFRTYSGARGTDRTHSARQLVLTPDTPGVQQISFSNDHEDAVALVYAAGQGAERMRQIVALGDPARIARSPFARRERLLDARTARDDDQLTTAAQRALAQGQPRQTVQVQLRSVAGFAYGREWAWGDRVLVAVAGRVIPATITTVEVQVTYTGAGVDEQITALLHADALPLEPARPIAPATDETEITFQQIQRGAVPAVSQLTIPTQAQLLIYGRYLVAGRLELEAAAQLVVLN